MAVIPPTVPPTIGPTCELLLLCCVGATLGMLEGIAVVWTVTVDPCALVVLNHDTSEMIFPNTGKRGTNMTVV